MKDLLLSSFFLLIAFSLAGCDKEEDMVPMDLNLLEGTWVVVESDVDNRNCIYEIKTTSD